MPDLAIDRALAAVRSAIAVTGFHAPEVACELEESALAILEAAWGTPGIMTAPGPDLVRAVRAGCMEQDRQLGDDPGCNYPECGCNVFPFAVRAAFAALLADPPPAVKRAVLERLIAEQQREREQLQQDDPYFVPHIEARIDFLSDRLAELGREESEGGH